MKTSHPYPALARLTISEYLVKGQVDSDLPAQISTDPTFWSSPAACFVTLKTKAGELRGCIGTIIPTRPDLGQEIMANAISAATQDPRFPPLTSSELGQITISVDILSTPESISGPEQLDPSQWGVIVEKQGLRGLLLPNLEGVDTVAKQLDIAARKAGLPGPQGASLKRFSVSRYHEA